LKQRREQDNDKENKNSEADIQDKQHRDDDDEDANDNELEERREERKEEQEEQEKQSQTEKNSEYTEMTPLQKRLFNLRMMKNACRKENQKEVFAETVREKENPEITAKKRKLEAEEYRKREEEEMRKNGKIPEKEKMLLVTAEDADWLTKKKKKKSNDSGLNQHSNDTHYNAYKRRTTLMGRNLEEYKKAKESQTDFYREADSLDYGKAPVLPRQNIDRMVGELEASIAKRDTFRRRREYHDDTDITYINERNRVYNQKISRAFDKYTAEIKQNLERGTAV